MVDKEAKFAPDLFKHFFRTKSKGGFIALRPWFEAGKISVDIGETAVEGGLVSNTLAWVPVIPFAAYLKAIVNNTAVHSYVNEEFAYFGGGHTDNGPVSRILKVRHWGTETIAFEFKTGHFKASVSNNGAFIPDMQSPVSTDLIKVTRAQIGEMSYAIDLAVHAFTKEENWLSHLHGKERG